VICVVYCVLCVVCRVSCRVCSGECCAVFRGVVSSADGLDVIIISEIEINE